MGGWVGCTASVTCAGSRGSIRGRWLGARGVGRLVWLARLLGWLASLGGEPMDPSPRVMNNEKASGPWLDL
jgi:hypothetical protein